jgi:hypothetical protein
MNTQPILDFLQSKGFGIGGKTLFRDNMPAKVSEGILVTNQTADRRNPYVPSYVLGVFEITARASTYDEVRATMNSVSSAMTIDGVVMGDMKFKYIRPRNLPLVYPVSDADNVEASVLFDFRFILI